ncbi:hypothetical protein CEXT_290101 [Caerostris extrusa]|uniref:Uncharacterized protein n=1 Tax=Caerostris extrusa TaxID=172846 RepID=A0AAV4Y638_CAEEX|nr:hypothetical protein CEXT_290101 [Caerostris extrusa]
MDIIFSTSRTCFSVRGARRVSANQRRWGNSSHAGRSLDPNAGVRDDRDTRKLLARISFPIRHSNRLSRLDGPEKSDDLVYFFLADFHKPIMWKFRQILRAIAPFLWHRKHPQPHVSDSLSTDGIILNGNSYAACDFSAESHGLPLIGKDSHLLSERAISIVWRPPQTPSPLVFGVKGRGCFNRSSSHFIDFF